MILTLANAIDEATHARILERVAQAAFVDGRETAGRQLADVKRNTQIARNDPLLAQISALVLESLRAHRAFREATYPRHLHSVMVSRYGPGMAYGAHVDNALMGDETVWRTDLSLTLFLNAPEDYDGGELCLETGSGEIGFKPPARHMLCYPTSDLHRVCEVTRGERLVVVGWIQSYVRDNSAREILWDLAQARDQLSAEAATRSACERVNKAHTNLLRRWAEP